MKGKKVVVTTSYRGVFFGTLEKEDGTTVWLKDARNCVFWSANLRGFLGLVATGPNRNCKVGPKAPELKLHKVTSIAVVSDEAAANWEAAPWA